MTDFAVRVEALATTRLRDPQFGVERLAEMVGITDRHLRRLLVAATGETPRAMIRRLRIAEAERLLADGSHSLRAVSRAVGYGDSDALLRAYHAVTGRHADRPSTPGGTVRTRTQTRAV